MNELCKSWWLVGGIMLLPLAWSGQACAQGFSIPVGGTAKATLVYHWSSPPPYSGPIPAWLESSGAPDVDFISGVDLQNQSPQTIYGDATHISQAKDTTMITAKYLYPVNDPPKKLISRDITVFDLDITDLPDSYCDAAGGVVLWQGDVKLDLKPNDPNVSGDLTVWADGAAIFNGTAGGGTLHAPISVSSLNTVSADWWVTDARAPAHAEKSVGAAPGDCKSICGLHPIGFKPSLPGFIGVGETNVLFLEFSGTPPYSLSSSDPDIVSAAWYKVTLGVEVVGKGPGGPVTITVADSNGCATTHTLSTLEVKITGFSEPYVYARHPSCPVSTHQATCAATISPPGSSTVTYSIQGNSHGATIDANTGLITPGTSDSGEITIRAVAAIHPNAYDEETFLIKARPTGITSSKATKWLLPAGGDWTHTFGSTGDEIEDEQITEEVIEVSWPFKFPGELESGSTWRLDSNHQLLDQYYRESKNFDVRAFFPSPGLPASGYVEQKYFWLCPSDWLEKRLISGPAHITHTLEEQGDKVVVRLTTGYNAAGEPLEWDYRGSAYLSNVQLNPPTIPADGTNTSTATVTVVPANRLVVWAIRGPDLGVSQNNNVFTAGTNTGTVVIRATDSVDSSAYSEGSLLLTVP